MARFRMDPGERGTLQLEVATDGTTNGYFVPREQPAADSPAAIRVASGAKLLTIPASLESLTVYPLDTRPWNANFLAAKYSQIVAIELPVDLEPNWDIGEVLENLPSGFTKDAEYGLGLAEECAPLVRLIEEHSGCSMLRFIHSGAPRIDGETFEISFQGFEAVRRELARIKNRGDSGVRRVRDHFVRTHLAELLGLEAKPLSLGRLQDSQWMTRVALGEAPLSDGEQTQLVAAALASASQLAAKMPEKMAELQREVELVNLDQLIVTYKEALGSAHGEEWWQDFFERNVFALQLLFGGPTVFVDAQVPIGEGNNSLKGKKIADYLFKNAMTSNASIVEIKKPSTKLLKKRPYRKGVYGVQSEIGEAVTQVLDQALQLTRYEANTKKRTRDSSWVSNAPRCFVVAGRLAELDTDDKKKSFDLYREHLSNVRIVAYDEILEALITLQEFMTVEESTVNFDA